MVVIAHLVIKEEKMPSLIGLFDTIVTRPNDYYQYDSVRSYYSDKDENTPERFVKRTLTKFESMPLIQLKEMGFWNRRLDKIIPFLPKGAWIAGGFLRSIVADEDDSQGDIDFFFNNEKAFSQMLDMIKNPPKEAKNIFGYYNIAVETPTDQLRVVTCHSEVMNRPDIQLIRLFWYESPEHVIDGFDFTVCQLATDGEKIYYNPLTFDDIRTKTIRPHRDNVDAIVMLNRLIKYSKKGYKVSSDFFDEVEVGAIEMFNNDEAIQDYFYKDKNDSETHGHPASFLKYAWEYLAEHPKTSAKFAKMTKRLKVKY